MEDFTQQRHLSGIFPHCCEGFIGQRALKVQEYYVNRSTKLRENIFFKTRSTLPSLWFEAVTSGMFQGNAIHDVLFDGQPINLDVEDAVEC